MHYASIWEYMQRPAAFFLLLIASGGCSAAPASNPTSLGPAAAGLSSAAFAAMSEAGPGLVEIGQVGPAGVSCPARAGVASCPALPSSVTVPSPLIVSPTISEPGYWVGCAVTHCLSPNACTTCECLDSDGAGAWQCNNLGFEAIDASSAPYCSRDIGPLDADTVDGGPIEYCTPQYPTCTNTLSAGWHCCLRANAGSLNETICMPSDSDF
jgi:hypothetical protein